MGPLPALPGAAGLQLSLHGLQAEQGVLSPPPRHPPPSAGAAGSLRRPTQPPSIPELGCTGRAARWGGQDRALPRQPAALGSTAGTARSRLPFRCGLSRQVGAGEESARPCQGKEERAWLGGAAGAAFKMQSARSLWSPPACWGGAAHAGGAAPRCWRSSDCGCCSAPRLHGENGTQVLQSRVWGSRGRAVPGTPGGALGGLGLGVPPVWGCARAALPARLAEPRCRW